MCSSGYNQCRAYTSFINRKYYLVAERASSSILTVRLQDTTNFPPSCDNDANFYSYDISWAGRDDRRYYRIWDSGRSSSILYPATPSYSINPTLYGSTLSGYQSGFIFSINLNGKTLYSNKRNYGHYQGSFMRLTLSGFSSLFGCGATLSNRLSSISAPFYCEVKSSNTL